MPPEELYGNEGLEQAAGYERLPDNRPKEVETGHYSSDADGLAHAAMDLENQRAERMQPPIERKYAAHQGTGEEIPEHFTVKADRAADDLAKVREVESAEQLTNDANNLAQVVDQVRSEALKAQFPELAQPDQQAQQPDIAQPQPDVTPEPPVPGVDPEISKALENPKVRAALEAEVQQIAAAKQQYVAATDQALKLAGASFFATFPELQGMNAQELPVAVTLMQKSNPQRAAAILEHAQRVQSLYSAGEAAKADIARNEQQRLNHWMAEQDKAFDAEAAKDPARYNAIKQNAAEVLGKDYGLSHDDMMALNNNPLTRSAIGQRILGDAIAFRLAQRNAMQNPARNLPPVQRPGVSSDRQFAGDDSAIRAAEARFNKTGNPKDAAALLIARRAANR